MRLAAFLISLATLANAQGPAPPARWYVQVDNDALLDTDRWYSSGLRIGRVHASGAHEVEVSMLQEVHSPEAERFVPGVIDRAPTARLLLALARHDRTATRHQTLEAAVGVRGPSALGRQVTGAFHRLVSAADIAWSRQESDRLDAYLAGVRSHRLDAFDLHYGAVLGNEIAFVHAGGAFHVGARAPPTPALRHAPTPPWGGEAGWGAFAGASIRGIARNEMLKRSYSSFGGNLERRDWVGRAVAGLGWTAARLSFSAALVHETREFEGQRAPHQFISATLHAAF